MAIEIERKFLVADDRWRAAADGGTRYRQGYLTETGVGPASVRVRIGGGRAFLNIKSHTLGMERREYEYPLPLDEAEEMLEGLCRRPLIEKTRYRVRVGDHLWEIDEFFGENAGLVVAEIELSRADEPFDRPPWLGREVTDDPRYYNVCLVDHPYSRW